MSIKGIDLFAGVGGFHQASSKNNIDIVFASEIDERTSETYYINYGLKPYGDITKINEIDIPAHDILMGGFPCQPFSKAGLRMGFEDSRGTLFFDIARILKYHKPKFVLLENVQSLTTHDSGNTWKTIYRILNELGYLTLSEPLVVSPTSFGTPQIRKRVFIPCVLKEHAKFEKLKINIPTPKSTSIEDIRIAKYDSDDSLTLNDYQRNVIDAWSEFKNYFSDWKEIQHPIWSYEFFNTEKEELLPEWKHKWNIRNRELYLKNKKFINAWYKKWDVSSFRRQDQKLEWNAKGDIDSLEDGIIQFRSSGIRVKTPDVAPTLVAKNDRIIMPGAKRFISIEEASLLQDFRKDFKWPESESLALKQLGNAVNVKVTSHILKELINNGK